MKVLFVGSDRSIFDVNSNSFKRMQDYSTLFEELHIIVFNKEAEKKEVLKISKNAWAYPTNSTSKLFYIFGAFKIAKNIIEKGNILDWVVSTQDPFESGIVGVFLKLKFGIKFQIQIHTDFLSRFFGKFFLNKIRLIIAKFTIPLADQIRVVSLRIKESLLKKNVLDSNKIEVLPIFTDLNKFKFEGEKFDFKKIKPDWNKILLTVCRVEEEKNLSGTLNILREVFEKDKKVGWVLVGEGSEFSELKKEARKMGVSPNVLFFGSSNDLPPIYRGADLYIQTSFFEGFGLSAVEAYLCGLKIVTTDVGMIGWILKESGDVKVCDLKDKKCFVNGIFDLLKEEKKVVFNTDFVTNNLPKTKEQYLNNYKSLFDKLVV